jgi:hypothetical protein
MVGNLLGSLAVLGVAVTVAFGLPAIDRSLPAARPVIVGRPFEVGAGVVVVPPPGAQVDVTQSRPGVRRGTALFLLGPVRYAIVVSPFAGSLDDAAARLRGKIRANRGYQVVGRQRRVTTGTGLAGLGGGYAAPGRQGWYSVFLVRGSAIEVTVSGAHADLSAALAGVRTSIRSLTVRRVR